MQSRETPDFTPVRDPSIRYGDWKLHGYVVAGGLELYHLITDPGEKVNLADQAPDRAIVLRNMLNAWRTDAGAPIPTALNPDDEP